MRSFSSYIVIIIMTLLVGIIAFDGESQQTSTPTPTNLPPTYERDVVSILHTYCIVCHDSLMMRSGFNLESYESLMRGGEKGPAIIPGKSGESLLVLMLEGKVEPRMPFETAPLADSDIAIIKTWIDAGALKEEGEGRRAEEEKAKGERRN